MTKAFELSSKFLSIRGDQDDRIVRPVLAEVVRYREKRGCSGGVIVRAVVDLGVITPK